MAANKKEDLNEVQIEKDVKSNVKNNDIKSDDVKSNVEIKFSKKQIIGSNRFRDKKDAIGAILEDDKEYTIHEVEKLYDNFMKGEVK